MEGSRPRRIIAEDSDEESAAGDVENLFDEVDNEEVGSEPESSAARKGRVSIEEREEAEEGEEGEEEDIFGSEDDNRDQEVEIEQLEMELTIPRYPTSHVPDKDTYFARVPAFISVDPKPLDPAAFLKAAEEHDDTGEESRKLRLQNENTIRWKYGRDSKGNMTKVSNSRIVTWSDGSMSLQLGSELFDVVVKPVEDTFLVVSHTDQEVLQTSAILNKSMTFVPTSTSSLTHKRFTEALSRRQLKSASVGNYATVDDPDRVKREAEKAEELNMRARKKLENKRRQLEGREYEGGFGRPSSAGTGARESSGYGLGRDLERDQEPFESTRGYGRSDHYEHDDFVVEDEEEDSEANDEDEELEEAARAQRLRELKQKGSDIYKDRKKKRDDDDDEDEDEDEEEEEEEREGEGEEGVEVEEEEDDDRPDRSRGLKKRRIIGDDDEDE